MSFVGRNHGGNDTGNRTNLGYSPFDAINARTFLDAAVSDRLSAFVQIYFSASGDAFLYGAYARYDHSDHLHLEAGLIPTAVGLWGSRTYGNKNPLISTPAIYQFKTSLDATNSLQTNPSQLLAARGSSANTPTVYDFCWNSGVHAYGSIGQFDMGLAINAGSLGRPSRQIVYPRPNLAMHLTWIAIPLLSVGAWASAGPYLSPTFEIVMPTGTHVEDFLQKTIGVNTHVSGGHADFFAEALFNRFEHPYFGNLDNAGGYGDIQYAFSTRWWIAARVDLLSFSLLNAGTDASAGSHWDFPLSRYEFGIGRHLSERSILKGIVQVSRYSGDSGRLDDEIYAVQMVVEL